MYCQAAARGVARSRRALRHGQVWDGQCAHDGGQDGGSHRGACMPIATDACMLIATDACMLKANDACML
jgi:hypothetical protein